MKFLICVAQVVEYDARYGDDVVEIRSNFHIDINDLETRGEQGITLDKVEEGYFLVSVIPEPFVPFPKKNEPPVSRFKEMINKMIDHL